MKSVNKRGQYKRQQCPIHGLGHRYPTTIQEKVNIGDHVEVQTFKVCGCGERKLIKSQPETKVEIQGRVTGEVCRNPWNPNCHNTKIALTIIHDGEERPICGLCWEKISESDKEWGD